MRARRLIVIVGLSGSAAAAGTALAADQTVTATSSNQFTPASVTVNQGETVTWGQRGRRSQRQGRRRKLRAAERPKRVRPSPEASAL
jgi:hypothetical protein